MPTETQTPPAADAAAEAPEKKAPRKRAPRKSTAKTKADKPAPEQDEAREQAGAAPAAGEPAEQPVEVEGGVEDVVQPADVDAPKGEVEIMAGGFGVLTLSPEQRRLTDDQRAALVAIGIDTNADPAVTPHVLPFIHMCQSRGLDPWAREAYLIGRGTGNNRKYTMQVGIDGYMKLAKSTGRYVRVKEVLWTGSDDDDRSWRAVEVDGRVVMRRVWWDQWPESKGHPGSAEVTIEHYDDFGNLTETTVVADWGMYAPYNDKWEGERGNRRKATGPDGQPIRELGEMWQRGGPYMLSKCGIALAVRRAFPGAAAGVYMHEEMHAADAAELRRLEQEGRNARARAVRELRTAERQPVGEGKVLSAEEALLASPSAPMVIDVEPEPAPPTGAAPQGALGTDGPEADEAQRQQWVLDEVDLMADVMDTSAAALMNRWVRQYRKNPSEGTVDELLPYVSGLRTVAISAMRGRGDDTPADHWSQVRPDACGPVEWLLGLPTRRDPQDGGGQRAEDRESGEPTLMGEVAAEVVEGLRPDDTPGAPA